MFKKIVIAAIVAVASVDQAQAIQVNTNVNSQS